MKDLKDIKTHVTISIPLCVRVALERRREAEEINRSQATSTSLIVEEILAAALREELAPRTAAEAIAELNAAIDALPFERNARTGSKRRNQ